MAATLTALLAAISFVTSLTPLRLSHALHICSPLCTLWEGRKVGDWEGVGRALSEWPELEPQLLVGEENSPEAQTLPVVSSVNPAGGAEPYSGSVPP